MRRNRQRRTVDTEMAAEVLRLRDELEAAQRPQQRQVMRTSLKQKLWVTGSALVLVVSAAAYLEAQWRSGVNQAMEQIPEIKVQAAAAAIEVRELRKEQLTFYAFFYERLGAAAEARQAIDLLQRLQRAPRLPAPRPTAEPK